MEGKARFWDTVTGRPIGPPMEPGQWVVNSAFSPDGRTALTWSSHQPPHLWDVPDLPDDLPRVATWVEVLTGLALDEYGDVQVLDRSGWLKRRERLAKLGGPPPTAGLLGQEGSHSPPRPANERALRGRVGTSSENSDPGD